MGTSYVGDARKWKLILPFFFHSKARSRLAIANEGEGPPANVF